MSHDVRFSVVPGDALKFNADVLLLKYAQRSYGLDKEVIGQLENKVTNIYANLPKPGECYLTESFDVARASKLLFVGVKPLRNLEYEGIRDFACTGLRELSRRAPGTRHVAATVHGTNYGLDESESLKAEVGGFLEAIEASNAPIALERITIVEMTESRARRLASVLEQIFPDTMGADLRSSVNYLDDVRTAGHQSEMKPRLFVAMPFSDEMEDVYHYGIQRAAHEAGFLCERADLSSFTGDILAWVKDRISTATLIVAELSGANPNVYLEIGYAWGVGRSTILLVRDSNELKFDVKGQRCLVYRKIRDLEEKLTRELKELSGDTKR
jgi:hypothetical protein